MNEDRSSNASDAEASVKQSCARIGEEVRNLLRALAPSDEVRGHFRTARVEVLKGLRAAIDQRIERLARDRKKGTSVTIE